jgi:putative sugar O-methyltransferase
VLSRFGLVAIRRSTANEILETHPWLADKLGEPVAKPKPKPKQKPTDTLSANAPNSADPRLIDLRRRYVGHPATTHSVWTPENLVSELTLERFREDNAYVWQTRVSNPIQYLISSLYVKDNDPLALFDNLGEDGAFGAHLYQHGDRPVSRDMLDSILEISFLEEQIGLSKIPGLTVLDIGAGYGRLAHRMAESMPNLARYLCADAVAESTFVSDFYTKFRQVDAKVTAVPLDEIERVVAGTRIDVALNIHSFSECSFSSIEYWLDLVARAEVPWLFIVPNTGDQLISWEPDQCRRDFLPAIEARGYELVVQRDKYHRSKDAQRFGLFPSTYVLFRRVNR